MLNGLDKAVKRAAVKPLLNRQLNKMVRDYRALLEVQKELTKKVGNAKGDLMEYDGISTDKYTIDIQVCQTESVVGKNILFDMLGEEEVRELGLLKEGHRKNLKIGDK